MISFRHVIRGGVISEKNVIRADLRGLGLDDSDIEGLEALNSKRKENGGATPYVITVSAVILLNAAAVVCAVAVRRKKA